MADYYFTASREDGTTLFLAPLTNRHIEASGQELPDTSGHFLYEADDSDPDTVRIIAQVITTDAVLNLKAMLGMT